MLRKVIGVTMVIDGVLQAMGVSAVLSTIAARSLRDQSLTAAHVIVGAALLFQGARLVGGGRTKVRPSVLTGPLNEADGPSEYVGPNFSSAIPIFAALALSVIETTWFDWIGTVVRAVYTVVALFVLTRKTTLPTT